ncbi:hypothetical protein Kuura_058 [Caulobacter phage Kuura]|nr:hypothetical protein Kuura_058 [Caulobacter phage Kuura]
MTSPLGDIPVTETVDLTPTWSAITRTYVRLLPHLDAEGHASVAEELSRMALAADRYQALVKLADEDQGEHTRALADALEIVCNETK